MCPRRSSSNDDVQKAIIRLIVIPIIALFGIYLAGVFIEALFEVPDAVKKLFWAIGGIAFFAWYFREELKKLIGR